MFFPTSPESRASAGSTECLPGAAHKDAILQPSPQTLRHPGEGRNDGEKFLRPTTFGPQPLPRRFPAFAGMRMLLNISPCQRRFFNRRRHGFLGVDLEIKVRNVAPSFALGVAGGDVGVGVDLIDGDVNHAPLKIIESRILRSDLQRFL